MCYYSFTTDLIIFMSLKFDRFTLIFKDNRTRFFKLFLLILVEIIDIILDNHLIFVKIVPIIFGWKRIVFVVRRNRKFPISLS